jgi:hypothetical protein
LLAHHAHSVLERADMVRKLVGTFILLTTVAVVPVYADDREPIGDTANADQMPALFLAAAAEHAGAAAADRVAPVGAADVDWSLPPVHFGAAPRGGLLPALYVSLAGLNAVDAYTTMKGLSAGATEANPLMKAVVGNSTAFLAVKGGVTAGSILVAERLWKSNRRAQAIAVMVVTNGMMAAVAARNVSVLRQR